MSSRGGGGGGGGTHIWKGYIGCVAPKSETIPLRTEVAYEPGGGGGTQIWFRRGCAAEAAKPIPIFKVILAEKVPLLRVFSQENDVFVYFSDEMGENYKSGGYV